MLFFQIISLKVRGMTKYGVLIQGKSESFILNKNMVAFTDSLY